MSQAENGREMGTRFLAEIREQPAALRRLLEHATARLGAVGQTYAEFARGWPAP